jgi:hypothetical protein
MSTPSGQPRVRRHLIDPNNPPRRSQGRSMHVSQVQKWVMSVLAVTTILHLSAGLIIAAIFLDDDRVDGRVGLNVIAGMVAVGAVVAFRAIHQKKVLSPWLALGVVPALVGLYLTF